MISTFISFIYLFVKQVQTFFKSSLTVFFGFLNIKNNTLYNINFKFFYQRSLNVLTFFYQHFLCKVNFLPLYYHRNLLIWSDGFLLDFLQKKTIDLLMRKFFIFTGFLFSERFIFEIVVKLYLDTLVWPLHFLSTLEVMNTVEVLTNLITFYFLFFSSLILFFLVI